jgi:2-polyprenyl-6-methoxyphenol hydroxylase-like FAD-dependent oxidoreductase
MTIADEAQARCNGRLRTLIVGAGVAATALAALLRVWGERPVIVERGQPSKAAGYNLGIYPVGGRIMHGLGLFPRYEAATVNARTYELFNGVGHLMQTLDLGGLFETYGPIAGIRRSELIELLSSKLDAGTIMHGTTIGQIEQSPADIAVTFSDGSVGRFDLLVGADGIHSATRTMVLPPQKIHTFDTGWSCVVTWVPADVLPVGVFREYWGAGFMLGLYGVKGEIGVVVAGPSAQVENARSGFLAHIRSHLQDKVAAQVLDAAEHDAHPFLWKLMDVRADEWSNGRVILLGDAADAFLPTAGVGASMAMLSAAALADELSRTDAAHLPAALQLYQRRQQPKVVAAQQNSRKLAHLMMVKSPAMAWGRELLMHFYSPDRALADIIKVMDGLV